MSGTLYIGMDSSSLLLAESGPVCRPQFCDCDAIENTPAEIIGYSDADWASDVGDRKSTSGYIMFLLGGAAITWKSSKQACVAL